MAALSHLGSLSVVGVVSELLSAAEWDLSGVRAVSDEVAPCNESVRRKERAAAGGSCANNCFCNRRDKAGVSPDSVSISFSDSSMELKSKSDKSKPLSTFCSEFCGAFVRCLLDFLILPIVVCRLYRVCGCRWCRCGVLICSEHAV